MNLSKEEIELIRITDKSKIEPVTPIITIRGQTVATKGGLFLISGIQKSGKSFVGKMFLSAALGYFQEGMEISVPSAMSSPVVFFNTEMSKSDMKKYHDDILNDLKLSQTPPNLFIIDLLDKTHKERLEFIEAFFDVYPDTFLALIDGAADLVTSANDEKESAANVESLLKLAGRYQTTIGAVVHENRKSGTTRGHYGQIFERKATGVISVKKEGKDHCIECNVLRHSPEFEPVWFKRTNEGVQAIERTKSVTEQKLGNDYEECHSLMSKVMNGQAQKESTLFKKELIAQYTDGATPDAKRKRAERDIAKAEKFGIIDYHDDKGKPSIRIQTKIKNEN